MSDIIKRRKFVQGSSALLGLGVVSSCKTVGGSAESSVKYLQDGVEDPIRANVNSPMGLRDLELYKFVIWRMKQRPTNDPLSWSAQATIHQQYCPHGGGFFLPWHRAFLLWFEDVARENLRSLEQAQKDDLVGRLRNRFGEADADFDKAVASFAVPYWDWSEAGGGEIPAPFWEPQSTLYNFHRNPALQRNTKIAAAFVSPEVMKGIMDSTNYESFAGSLNPGFDYRGALMRQDYINENRSGGTMMELERGPHNNVHVDIGQGTQDPMQSMIQMRSPNDPIFWLHHCNIDRIWYEWSLNQVTPPTPLAKSNMSVREWLDFPMGVFNNRAGQQVTSRIEDVLNPVEVKYNFDTTVNRQPTIPVVRMQSNLPSTPDGIPSTQMAVVNTVATIEARNAWMIAGGLNRAPRQDGVNYFSIEHTALASVAASKKKIMFNYPVSTELKEMVFKVATMQFRTANLVLAKLPMPTAESVRNRMKLSFSIVAKNIGTTKVGSFAFFGHHPAMMAGGDHADHADMPNSFVVDEKLRLSFNITQQIIGRFSTRTDIDTIGNYSEDLQLVMSVEYSGAESDLSWTNADFAQSTLAFEIEQE